MKRTRREHKFDLYYENKSQLKWAVLGFSLIISVASVVFTHNLVERLRKQEYRWVEQYAEAIKLIQRTGGRNNPSDQDLLFFLTTQVVASNESVPIILSDEYGNPINYNNVRLPKDISEEEKTEILKKKMRQLASEYQPIRIQLVGPDRQEMGAQFLYYGDSFSLVLLRYYPFVQLGLIAFFGFLSYMAFSNSRTAEQNKVWIGLAKETAHQLGTPLSSLMAWIEYLKVDPDFDNDEVLTELAKDTQRLETIANRFSNIGSLPVLEEVDVMANVKRNVSYLQKRISTKVKMRVEGPSEPVIAAVNVELFDWVIENLCKNAVDAMVGAGSIDIQFGESDQKIFIDVQDTGKGMTRKEIGKIFRPGFSTKKRGWGLGLTLAKRIMVDYHQGKLEVKSSEPGKGTTFRITLNKSE
ncbi:two-component sensor histidine kinase [Fulvitalea axinellae]|uniref:histidine kinase n=1 Tax=Fulvitalea axinellae TaxID=1182444 RepID=A0AAU9CK47_9BACT|nr:two-component sensor histidine kinase [Fulvitalea axinellae]